MSRLNDAYTLVVPTYNRSGVLASLLGYLEQAGAEFRILVLDSSAGEHRQRNRDLVTRFALRVRYSEYDPSILPFDKFREGIHKVETPLCSLCADDDLVIVEGIARCVEHLDHHPDVCVAHGYYFSFLDNGNGSGGMDLTGILYYAPDIDSDDPVSRLRKLFWNYQALTYGTYRTAILQHVLETVRPLESLLAHELLSSALSVVRGKAARLRCFTNGRSLAASGNYKHWHPLEWLIEWPEGLFAEYARYREILIAELMVAPAYGRSLETTRRLVDLIHMFYLLRHVPLETCDFILDHVMSESDISKFWSAMAIQMPLIEASKYLWATDQSESAPSALFEELSPEPGAWPKLVNTPVRQYRLHEQFMRPQPRELFTITKKDVARLLETIDKYRTDGAP